MTSNDAIARDLERQILEAHTRFSRAVEARLPHMNVEQRERYFALLSTLVGKLEQTEKPLREVLQESIGELLPLVLQELSSPG
jgi:hypothetical protein